MQLNPNIYRYRDSSIPALKIISLDGWNRETAYHFGDALGFGDGKVILYALIFRITQWGWNASSAVQLRSQPCLTALGTWVESIAMWNKVITETQTGYTRVLLSNKSSFGCPNICASFRNYLHSFLLLWLKTSVWTILSCHAVCSLLVFLFTVQHFLLLSLLTFPCDWWNTKVPHSNMEGPHCFLNLLIKVAVLKLSCLFLGFLRMHFLYKTFENILLKLWEMFKITFAMCNFYKSYSL